MALFPWMATCQFPGAIPKNNGIGNFHIYFHYNIVLWNIFDTIFDNFFNGMAVTGNIPDPGMVPRLHCLFSTDETATKNILKCKIPLQECYFDN